MVLSAYGNDTVTVVIAYEQVAPASKNALVINTLWLCYLATLLLHPHALRNVRDR